MPEYDAGQSSGFTLLPKGEYPFEVSACKLKTSSNGNEMFELVLEFPMNCTVFDNLVFTKSSAWKIDQFRESIGQIITPGKTVLNASDFIGARGRAVLKIENYDGKDRNKVEAYVPADIPRAPKDALEELRQAAAKAAPSVGKDEIPY